MATLRITGCRVNTTSITISFSEAVDQTTAVALNSSNATNPANYTISDPAAGFFGNPTGTLTVVDDRSVVIAMPSANAFNPGDWVTITVKGIGLASNPGTSAMTSESVHRQVPNDARRATRDVEDAVTYPILTEQVRFPRSGGGPTTGVSSSQSGAPLGQTAALAIGDVLGWKVSSTDPKGFVGALSQAFTLTDVEGHVESTWNPRTYAVQTDLGGGISGAQASLYTRAKDALDQSLSLLNGLYPLDSDADPEYVKALREMARSQMTEIVQEFGAVGLPSILRIDTYFEILLGQHPTRHSNPVQFDPDQVKGTLGQLRDTYGIYFRGNPFNNSIEDEQDITNFRVISDYMTSLLQSWIANREFFIVSPNRIAFFGTQLVLISRQLNVIAETVDEVRFTLDSVFIGPNERQTLLLKFTDHTLPPMFLEDVLVEIERFVEDEGPRLLRDGGKISITNNILPVVRSLKHMIEQAHDPENKRVLPDGFKTARVRHSLDDLRDQLGELIKLTTQVEQQVPFPEYDLRIDGVSAASSPDTGGDTYSATISFFGNAIDYGASVILHSLVPLATADYTVEYYSAERIDVTFTSFNPSSFPLDNGDHEVRVENPDGERATFRFSVNWALDSTIGLYSLTVAPVNGESGDYRNSGYTGSSFGQAAAIRRSSVSPTAALPSAPSAAQGSSGAPARPAPAPAAPPAPPAATVEHIAALQKKMDDMQTVHKNLFEQLESKIAGFFERKPK
ncbi:hypothetical protein [Acidicapsa acidisoli]|uniref:hypothetical protein n=1 Tax=Acidicapsa acidisoli TaxID=1615681 RepID=UPI0021E0D41E|nr:hypothetical protein [Acidicapsa acidisoli]